jgi:transcriptional regulator with XRE-family HTH domain
MKTPTEISTVTISRAIKRLREKLGFETQLPFARELDCQPGALARWERGESIPSGDWMLKILALCPDEESHDAFFVDIGEAGSKIPSISRPGVAKVEKEAPRAGAMRADGRIAPEVKTPGKRKDC